MKLDPTVLRLLGKEEMRVLRATEMGQRNHEIVPVTLIDRIAKLKHGGALRSIRELLKHKLLHHENREYDGYRLTNMGYDYLAIHTLVQRGSISKIGGKIGVGKESDVYEVTNDEGDVMILKLHRLGRTSFRAVKTKRDYLRHRSNYSWLYLSRLAALGEFSFMKALHDRGFPVPEAVDQNRHAVLMSRIDGFPLSQVRQVGHPRKIMEQIFAWMEKLVEVGLVHCDFNEFNLMVNEEEEITIIDFPQMISVKHENAKELFDRDVECIFRFFRRLGYAPEMDGNPDDFRLDFDELMSRGMEDGKKEGKQGIDAELAASGFKSQQREILERHAKGDIDLASEESDGCSESGESSDGEEDLKKEFDRLTMSSDGGCSSASDGEVDIARGSSKKTNQTEDVEEKRKEVQQRVARNHKKQASRQHAARNRRNANKDKHSKAGKRARAMGGGLSLI
ncbi:hypothetical protein BSKO_02310 [Bryopsis sp. KO-2023]|nr:hypothetical protein BSKO_02310 [Bryopsis sp. KO-2023]